MKCKALNNKKGMTMVNILVAFALLSMVLLLFSQAVQLTMNIYVKAEDERKRAESLYADFYTDTARSKDPIPGGKYSVSGTEVFTFKEISGATQFQITDSGVGEYQKDGSAAWFFGNRKEVTP